MKNLIEDEVYKNLPEELRRLTENFKDREKDIVLLSTLGAISSILPNIIIEYRGDKYSANLFVMIIAPPASGKGKMNLALKLVEPIHKRLIELSQCINDKNKSESEIDLLQKLKIVPGNVTCSKLYKHLSESINGIIIFESEADSISSMINQEWGNFSDVLRKAFHHEKISMSRSTDDVFFEVDSPSLSLVTSGTPNQLKPLIKSKENGLFSRMCYYYFEDKSYWKPTLNFANEQQAKERFEVLSQKMYDLYGFMKDRAQLNVKLSVEQNQIIDKCLGELHDKVVDSGLVYFASSVKRHGVVLARIILILTVLRNIDTIENCDELEAGDLDVENAIVLIRKLIFHALSVYDLFDNEVMLLPENETEILNKLSESFKRREAIVAAEEENISSRTADEYLKRWVKNKVIRRVSNGHYRKLSQETARVAKFAIFARNN